MRSLSNILFLLSAIVWFACETVVDVDIPEEPPRLVANAFLRADSAVVLELTQSQSILTNTSLQPVAGATAVLLEEDQAVATLAEVETGVYYADFTPSVGKSYTLQVSREGFAAVEATTFVSPAVAIREVQVDTLGFESTYYVGDSVVTEPNFLIEEVRLTFDDPGHERNYYEVFAYRYETIINGVTDAQGNYEITDTLRTLRRLYLNSDDPALSDEAGGFLEGSDGVFGETFLFSDDFFNGNTYTLRFRSEDYRTYDIEPKVYIVLRTIDEGQYRYFRSVDLQYENDGNPFAEPVQVYSNVANGYGIVSGSSADQVVIELD